MTCSDVRAALPLWLYDDLKPDAAADVSKHLAGCPACREAAEGLRAVRSALAAVPEPAAAAVDLSRLFHDAAALQERRLRRWRRVAVGVAALAAALLLVVGLRLEVRIDARQLVVRWGGAPGSEAVPVAPSPPPVVEKAAVPVPSPGDDDERLRTMQELIHALADDQLRRDDRQRQEWARIQGTVEQWHWRTVRRLESTESDVRALYAAQFGPRNNPGGE
jgi:Putative zinc-finger